MRVSLFTATLAFSVSLFCVVAFAQQYAGDAIPNSLPTVPGSEITYFRVKDPSGKNKNLTLINYYSHQTNDQRIVESQINRAVVIIHGLNRDPGTYESNMMSALAQVTSDPNVNRSTVAIMAPYFPNGDDKSYGYPWTNGLSPGRGSTTNCLVWKSSQWSAGGNNQYPYTSTNTSSYTVLDQIIQYFRQCHSLPKHEADRNCWPFSRSSDSTALCCHWTARYHTVRRSATGSPTQTVTLGSAHLVHCRLQAVLSTMTTAKATITSLSIQ